MLTELDSAPFQSNKRYVDFLDCVTETFSPENGRLAIADSIWYLGSILKKEELIANSDHIEPTFDGEKKQTLRR